MRPRVVSVCLDLSPSHGGMYRAVTDLARMLQSPIVTFRDGSGREPPAVPEVPVTTIDWSHCSRVRQAFFPPRSVRRAVDAAITNADCMVVHSLFRSHAMVVHRLAKPRGIPYVVVPHGALEPALWRSKRLFRKAWMLAGGGRYLRDAAKIVFATSGERHHAETTLGRSLQAAVIPFGVPAASEVVTADERASARKALELPPGRRLLLVLGRLDRVKRLSDVVEWFAAADPVGCDLVIAGMDGTLTAEGLRRAVAPGFRSRVLFLGGLTDTRRDAAVTACDGYLSWSHHESFGYAAAESLAAGLPVILPVGHGLRSEIEGVPCGLYPATDGREAFVTAVREFAGWSEKEIRARGETGRQWVRHHLDPEVVANAWRSMIRTVTA